MELPILHAQLTDKLWISYNLKQIQTIQQLFFLYILAERGIVNHKKGHLIFFMLGEIGETYHIIIRLEQAYALGKAQEVPALSLIEAPDAVVIRQGGPIQEIAAADEPAQVPDDPDAFVYR